MTVEPLTDHDLDQAVALLAEHGAPTPSRITNALDVLGLYGPGVDEACGVVEPAVDQWETGVLIPTAEQLARLASLTEQPVVFFFQPARPEPEGWLCIRSGPGKGCHRLRASDPVADPADPAGDVEQLGLFDAPDPVPSPDPVSAGRRRTQRQKATIARGRHPLTGGMAFPGASCGTCTHLLEQQHGARTYLKCGLGPISRGPATDVRRHWPACLRHPAAQAGLESKP